jgi:ribosomal protein L37E
MPQSWEIRRELFTQCGFPRSGWRRDNEKNSATIH